jgi:ribose transport system permease protein
MANTLNQRDWKALLKHLFVNYNYVFSFVLLLIVGRFASDQFLSVASISNLIRSSVFIGIIALGMTLTIISGNIDLSVGSILALAAALSVNTFNSSGSVLSAFLVAIAAGAGLGLINGLFVGYARMASFIVTLATMTAYRSITVQMGQGGPLLTDNALYFENLRWIGYGRLGGPRGLPYLAVIFVLLTLIMWFVMNKTKFGRYVYAVGSNERAAKLTVSG